MAQDHSSAATGSGQTTSLRLLAQLQHVRWGACTPAAAFPRLSLCQPLPLPLHRHAVPTAHGCLILTVSRHRRVLEARGELAPFRPDWCDGDAAFSDTFEDSCALLSHFDELSDEQARALP